MHYHTPPGGGGGWKLWLLAASSKTITVLAAALVSFILILLYFILFCSISLHIIADFRASRLYFQNEQSSCFAVIKHYSAI